jgi:UDP-N-acetylglucosamine--dolichyl-phosphate N-acetylglucosaminephosphotransferase
MGATIACSAIIVDMKAYGAIVFIPMIIEFFLKLRGKFKGENYGKPDKEGNLTYEGRIESLTHLIMRGRKIKEKHLVWIIWAVEALLCTILILSVLILRTAGI